MNNDLQNSAYHEAGHALLYYILGHDIKSIRIYKNGNGICYSYSYKPTVLLRFGQRNHEEHMLHWAFKCWSGWASEYKFRSEEIDAIRIYNNVTNSYEFDEDDEDDEDELVGDFESLILEMNEMNNLLGANYYEHEFFNSSYHKTLEIISQPDCWSAIITLSNAILNTKDYNLDGTSVHNIIDSFNLKRQVINRFLQKSIVR